MDECKSSVVDEVPDEDVCQHNMIVMYVELLSHAIAGYKNFPISSYLVLTIVK